ncbi:MAG TPA: Uma2 family endonuclease [Longimicrobiaceae bacterium]|nr:Uma2 family endonuclease [Longimicrobiaceae bacterium]
MSTQIKDRPVTADELLRMPDDGFRYELVQGEIRKMTPAGGQHGRIALKIGSSLLQHVEERQLGAAYGAETGFKLATNPDTVRAPDLAFLSRERAEAVGEVQGYVPGAPDLAVEVVSPGDTYGEVEEKVLEWLDAGTRMVVVVNPRRRTAVVYHSRDDIHVLSDEDVLDGGDVVPGWTLPVKSLFA